MIKHIIWRLRIIAAIILLTVGICMGMGDIRLRWKSHSTPPFPVPDIHTEQFGTGTNVAGNTTLVWKTFMHRDHPRDMVILVHGGGFRAGVFVGQNVAADIYYAGYNVGNVQYRLADPGRDMHPPGGDQPVDDHGLYPEQPTDVATAITAARTGSTASTAGFVTGRVYGVGGSAGATHVAYLTGAPLNGEQFDCGAGLSGAYDMHDPVLLADTRCNFVGDLCRNWVGCVTGPGCDGDGGQLDLASAYRRFTSTSHPMYIVTTSMDVMTPSQSAILRDKCIAVGSPYTYRMITEGDYADGCSRHEFQYWVPRPPDFPEYVKDDVINFLNSCQVAVASPTPTATATPTVPIYIKGVWCSYGPDPNIPAGLVDNLGVVGIGVSVDWNQVETAEGSYDFTDIDARIGKAVAGGFKNIGIVITDSSQNTPTWLLNKVAKADQLLFLDPASVHPTYCMYVQTIPYWNTDFHNARKALIAKMGQHFTAPDYPYRTNIVQFRMASFANHNSQDWNVQDKNGTVTCPDCGHLRKPHCTPTPSTTCQECGAFPVNQPQQWINFAGSGGGWTEPKMLQIGKDIADACAAAFPNANITLPIGVLSDTCMSTPDQDPKVTCTHGNLSQMARDMELYVYGDGGANPGKTYKNRFWMMRNTVNASWQDPVSVQHWNITPPGFDSDNYIKYIIYNHSRAGGTFNTPGHSGLQMVADASGHATTLNQDNTSCDAFTGDPFKACVMQKALDAARAYGTTYIEVFPQDGVNTNFFDMISATTSAMGGTPRTPP